RVGGVLTSPVGRTGPGQHCAHTPHLCAKVMALQINRHAIRLEQCLQGIHNLLPDPFLNRETLREQANEAREVGDANDPRASDVALVGMPEKWQGLVFAEGKEGERPLDHLVKSASRLSPAFCFERRDQLRVAVIACRYVQESADKAPWGVSRGRG